jgi:hypothetical protein
MTKSEWEQAYQEFDKALYELSQHEHEYKYGSNKQKRQKADRQMGYAKTKIEYLFRKYPEVYAMATGGEKATEYDITIVRDEFFQNRYVVGDMGNLLRSMNEKIKTFDESAPNSQ